MNPNENMSIGQRIKQKRLEAGLSVEETAKRLNKNRATIYRYESDEIENLPISILSPLANVLNTTPAYLMGWSEELEMHKNNITQLAKEHNKNFYENQLLSSFNDLNDEGKKEAIKRVNELTELSKYKKEDSKVVELNKNKKEIWEEPGKEHLMPVACHDDNLTDEEKNIMNEKINEYIKKQK